MASPKIRDLLPRKGVLKWFVSAVTILVIAAAAVNYGFMSTRPETSLLDSLPVPDTNSPLIMISARRFEFPLYAARMFADSATVSPSGSSPVNALLPVLDLAEQTAIVVTERRNGLAIYGAFSLSPSERASLISADLPSTWRPLFVKPEIRVTDIGSVLQIRASNTSSPLYVELDGSVVYIADSLYDMDRMRETRVLQASGKGGKRKRQWSMGDGWGAHMILSDGGVLSSMISPGELAETQTQVKVELAWRSSGDEGAKSDSSGEILWRADGLEEMLGTPFLKSARAHNWTKSDLFVPDPLIASFGVSLSPPKDVSEFPSPIRYLSEQFQRLDLRSSEIQSLLTGPVAFSIGGRTQILWFDLPGLVLEMQSRGKISVKLIEKFWSELFMGAEVREIPGYKYGGITDMPFTIMAAGNDEEVVIGLTEPDVEKNLEVTRLLASETSAVGWLFLDLPKLGAALAEMPSINDMLSPDGEDIVDSESTNILRSTMENLGRLFVVWDKNTEGHALWYY
ncbi:MAG: hypothetical protein LBT08_09085 [Synergistaceae bacterium]|jgi:hypothetical protein|nr:hypothetical protein [Synergistaceae bacterium]